METVKDYLKCIGAVCAVMALMVALIAASEKGFNGQRLLDLEDRIEALESNPRFGQQMVKNINWLRYMQGEDRKHAEGLRCFVNDEFRVMGEKMEVCIFLVREFQKNQKRNEVSVLKQDQ